MMPKELLDLLRRIMGSNVNTDDIRSLQVNWDEYGLDIYINVRR